MKNPFQFGRELGLGSLVDRQKELAAIEQSIRDGNKLFLIGPRRFGKTSILKTAADRLSAKSAIILRLDAESYPTIDMLVAAIVSESAKALKGGVKRVGEQIQNVFSILRPELDYILLSAHLGHDFPGISGAVFSRRGTARHRRGISRVRR